MLSRVAIQNFKSIGEPGVDLELAPLTFLVGPNGGGKSSIMEAILLASHHGLPRGGPGGTDARRFRGSPEPTHIFLNFESIDTPRGSYELSISGSNRNEEMTSDTVGEELFDRVFPLSATRQVPETSRMNNAEWVGEHGEHTLEILDRSGHARYVTERSNINKWATVFNMQSVSASLREREVIEGSYRDRQLDFPLSMELASSGSRQVLPIIVQLFWADPGSIITIEEPEISLHPEMQLRMVEMFAEVLEEGKQIISATHSLFMLQGIGYGIIKGWLPARAVAVYHVEKKKTIGTVVKRLPLTEKGYIKGWVPSFTRVERKLLTNWLNSLPQE